MRYLSTRDKETKTTASGAITMGLSRDGGLFVPEQLPRISRKSLESMCGMNYRQRAVFIMNQFLDDFTSAEITLFCEKAYSSMNFDDPGVAPLHKVDEKTSFMELWHGPTCAFKDMALQILPYLLTASLDKVGEDKEVCILVATSGDTGKAALEGFKDVDRTKILVFYPRDGVSDIQKLQMVTQEGGNVGVCAVKGNFDDAQNGVKSIFSDEELREILAGRGYFLSSANSINWGRLLPQIVYYFSAYCDMVKNGSIVFGDEIHFSVPTGNFGDILAGYYAKCMGLPVGRLICASNENNVLTDFINTGVYDRNRTFHTTISPSMDILISSNLERLLFELTGREDELVAHYMKELSQYGKYEITNLMQERLVRDFSGYFCDDEKTKLVIRAAFKKFGYLIDPHTAVAYDALNHYRHDTQDDTPAVVVSTASPYKFCDSVLDALGDKSGAKGLDLIDRLSEVTKTAAPKPLTSLRAKTVRFDVSVDKEQMRTVVEKILQ